MSGLTNPASFLVVGLIGGCASLGGLRSAPLDEGELRSYPVTLGTAVPAARAAVRVVGLDVEDTTWVDSTTWMLLATRAGGFSSYGELVRVVVHGTASDAVAVRVVSRRRLATNVFAPDWTGAILTRLDQALGGATSPSVSLDLRLATLRGLKDGQVIRVSGAFGTREGAVVDRSDSVVTLAQRTPANVVRVAEIDSVWLRRGHAGTGAIVGSLIGAIGGVAIASNATCPSLNELGGCFTERYLTALGGAAGGALLGAAVGSGVHGWRLLYP